MRTDLRFAIAFIVASSAGLGARAAAARACEATQVVRADATFSPD